MVQRYIFNTQQIMCINNLNVVKERNFTLILRSNLLQTVSSLEIANLKRCLKLMGISNVKKKVNNIKIKYSI